MHHDFESNTPVAISPTGPVTVRSTLAVPADLGHVRDVNVRVRIRHTWTNDLRITLIAPTGDRVVLVDREGGDGDDFTNTVFDDSVPERIEGAVAPFSGQFQPHESLSRLDGIDAGGDWTIEVADTASRDGGALEHWRLDIETDRDGFRSDVIVPIDPGPPGVVTSTIAVTGHGSNVIDSIAVSLDLDHSYTGDLRISLLAPDGTAVLLFNRAGGQGDDLRRTVFDDGSATLIDDADPPFTGEFRPHEPLDGLVGRFADGIWTLQIEDTASQDGGQLNSWSLDLQTKAPEAPTASEFRIDVRFSGGLSPTQRSAFTLAAARWAEVIVGDLPPVVVQGALAGESGLVPGEEIDDLVIEAKGEHIDGPRGTLGMAGPRFIRSASGLPINGIMTFDSSDLAEMEADGSLEDVIIHEMGHVLGLGTLWEANNLIAGANTPEWRYIGENAMREYGALKDQGETAVPVETDGDSGTAGGHWDEETFKNELMTGFVNDANNPLSRITIGCLEDLGYQVNYDVADGYSLPSLFSITSRRAVGALPCRVQFTTPERF